MSDAGVPYDLYSLGFSREEYIFYTRHFHQPVPKQTFAEDGLESTGLEQDTSLQRRLLRTVGEAVDAVPVNDLGRVTVEEIGLLQDALRKEIRNDKPLHEAAARYDTEMKSFLDQLLARLAQHTPQFIIVQERDWKWSLALNPRGRQWPLMEQANVGSRKVLLIANEAGQALLQEQEERVNTAQDLSGAVRNGPSESWKG
ncbi:MAG: hypothetical protein HYV26_23175, partial [Candidatus Hydrogenedentes bacterium]|nr:hypothetical protein [Candidatus Hydrogenedentota bacterium]